MNGQLYKHMINPWLASAISFALITIFFVAAFLIMPNPLPTTKDIASMPWWAVVGGLVGAVQVYAGLTLVNKVGAGTFIGVTVTAALIMSLLIDHFGWLRWTLIRSPCGGPRRCVPGLRGGMVAKF
ncbi:hypothetical protein I551_4688 [Mycobacterium ulcerans str. Harvey]|uniref:Uncharacterized protein n=1 Tax=Mycobacterium ulcerans str. Harvey TaxID=1299332 RepID=A0ABN0QVP0_MYCUL|nr:hypothetical protein I551_4688 [Mycobacterium ulcerans str. Harvey]